MIYHYFIAKTPTRKEERVRATSHSTLLVNTGSNGSHSFQNKGIFVLEILCQKVAFSDKTDIKRNNDWISVFDSRSLFIFLLMVEQGELAMSVFDF